MRKSHKLKKFERSFPYPKMRSASGFPVGKSKFGSVARYVKRVLGMTAPIVFVESPASPLKLAGQEAALNVE
jgi:hypothetical protein